MKYLIVAIKQDGYWNATLYKSENNPLFDVFATAMANETIITLDNYNVVERGIILTETIDYDTECIMRGMGFRKCDVCGEWVSPQDIRNGVSIWDRDNDMRYCASCYARKQIDDARRDARAPKVIPVMGYHETGDDVIVINGEGENFDLSNVLGIGIEMEANGRTSMIHNGNIMSTERFYEIANPRCRNRIFRVERDSTVQVEFISNIFTKKSLYDFDWSILTEQLRLLGNDERINDVGFHVHLSKLWLGDTPKEQCLNFLKLQYFLKCYESDFFKISGRDRDHMEWCQFYSLSSIEAMKSAILRTSDNGDPWFNMTSSHGFALINSRNTIELRIGKSTNDPVKIENYLKLVLGIVENAKNVPFSKCYCLGKMTRLVPNEVMNYWRRQGCFLSTNAINERGITLEA